MYFYLLKKYVYKHSFVVSRDQIATGGAVQVVRASVASLELELPWRTLLSSAATSDGSQSEYAPIVVAISGVAVVLQVNGTPSDMERVYMNIM